MDATARRVRRFATGASGVVTVLYLLLGLGVVTVVAGQEPGVVPPLLIAAALFAALTVLLARSARVAVLIAGVALQAVVILGYLAVASERTPPFEPWGIGVKALQVLLLAAFVYLALRRVSVSRDRPAAPA